MSQIFHRLMILALLGILGACARSDAPTAAVPAATGGGDTGASPAAPGLESAPSGTYVHDTGHSYIAFSYDHKGYSAPHLLFRKFDATLELNAQDASQSKVAVDIDVASVDSGVEKFDKHLRSADFFDVASFPNATFRTTAFAPDAGGGTLTGVLTIKDISKPVTLDVKINKVGTERDGATKIGVSARGEILRSDFGVDLYAPTVGDNVSLIIESEFVQPM